MHIELNDAQLDAFAASGFLIIDDFLENNLAATLLAEAKTWQEQEAFYAAGIGKLENHVIKEDYRKDKIKWINKEECLAATKQYVLILEDLMQQLSRAFFLSLKDYECMFAIYPSGAFYKKHQDQFKKQAHRIISVVLYLNEDWQEKDGGQLMIYKEGNDTEIKPIFNRLVFFKSEMWHEVLPCTKERYSLTGWMKDQENDIFFL